jgi:hypothetical protein
MAADGAGVRRLADQPQRHDYACWHPDGDKVLVVAEAGGKSDLHLLEVRDL